jgi:hypothetical protein
VQVDDYASPQVRGGAVEAPEPTVIGREHPSVLSQVTSGAAGVGPPNQEIDVSAGVLGGGTQEAALNVRATQHEGGQPLSCQVSAQLLCGVQPTERPDRTEMLEIGSRGFGAHRSARSTAAASMPTHVRAGEDG